MNSPNLSDIQNVALLNFGGIGDEILFAPVIQEIRKYLPHSHIVLFLEGRSRSVESLLPSINEVCEVTVQKKTRPYLFLKLAHKLKNRHFDLVISSGSSPFIAPMLWLGGSPLRFGFQSKLSHFFLTQSAPLNLTSYAGDMYFSLAKTCLNHILEAQYTPPLNALPALSPPDSKNNLWAQEQLKKANNFKKILIHPGVSRVSIEKGIVKSWAPKDWALLIQRLINSRDKTAVFLVGGPDDETTITQILSELPKDLPRFFNLYGETRSLSQLAALIHQADLLVSVDSAPMHIAVGMNTPVVALFGELDPIRLLPKKDHFIALRQTPKEATSPFSKYLDIKVTQVETKVNQRLNFLEEEVFHPDKEEW